MSDEHTIVTGFRKLESWGDLTSLEDRRFYLRRFVRIESDNQIRSATNIEPGGYDTCTSNLFVVNDAGVMTLVDYQREVLYKVEALPDNIRKDSPEWEILQQGIIPMSREFKIHLQPQEQYIPDVLSALIKLIMQDNFLQQNIIAFKCRVVFQKLNPLFNRAIIILYLDIKEKRKEARQMCQYILTCLKNGLADYEFCANGHLPIYNYPISDLISFIQIGTGAKFHLERILGLQRFKQLFPEEFFQALLMDEKPEYYL